MSIPPAVYILKCPHLGHISASNVCWDCACDQNIARLSTDHMMNERNLVTASWFLFFFCSCHWDVSQSVSLGIGLVDIFALVTCFCMEFFLFSST